MTARARKSLYQHGTTCHQEGWKDIVIKPAHWKVIALPERVFGKFEVAENPVSRNYRNHLSEMPTISHVDYSKLSLSGVASENGS